MLPAGTGGDADDGLTQLDEEDTSSDNELMTSDESMDEFQTLPDESGEMDGDQVKMFHLI